MPSCGCGPGYKSPKEAMEGPKEEIVYTLCIQPEKGKPDYLAVVDVKQDSPTFSKVIHRVKATHDNDEIHHFGWNACSSCHMDPAKKRDKLVIPCLGSDRIYILDTTNLREPKIHKVIEPEEMWKFDVSTPHTTHCLPSGDIMISTMGDKEGNRKGDFILLDGQTWSIKGLWTKGEQAKFGYDFWYQPFWDIMVSTEWAAPKSFKVGFHPSLSPEISGRSLNFFSWKDHKLIKTINLGLPGVFPLEVRFMHDPKSTNAFVGCALKSNVYRIFRKDDGEWDAKIVIHVPDKTVKGRPDPYLTGMITDILISLDDRFLYFSNWLHGDVRQYDISEPESPKLVGQIFLGGVITKDSSVIVIDDPELKEQPDPVYLKGRKVQGGPQMLQLSLDGKRLYVTTSLFSKWDKDIYPEMFKNGSALLRVNVDTEKGGLKLDESFGVDFGLEPDGPVLAHETRYPGGDCTSDIWLADEK